MDYEIGQKITRLNNYFKSRYTEGLNTINVFTIIRMTKDHIILSDDYLRIKLRKKDLTDVRWSKSDIAHTSIRYVRTTQKHLEIFEKAKRKQELDSWFNKIPLEQKENIYKQSNENK